MFYSVPGHTGSSLQSNFYNCFAICVSFFYSYYECMFSKKNLYFSYFFFQLFEQRTRKYMQSQIVIGFRVYFKSFLNGSLSGSRASARSLHSREMTNTQAGLNEVLRVGNCFRTVQNSVILCRMPCRRNKLACMAHSSR